MLEEVLSYGLKHFLARRTIAVKNRIFSALWVFIALEEKVIKK